MFHFKLSYVKLWNTCGELVGSSVYTFRVTIKVDFSKSVFFNHSNTIWRNLGLTTTFFQRVTQGMSVTKFHEKIASDLFKSVYSVVTEMIDLPRETEGVTNTMTHVVKTTFHFLNTGILKLKSQFGKQIVLLS